MRSELCLCCQRPVPDFIPTYCCNGYECGCRGEPCEPCVCSKECWDAIISGIGNTYEDRRIRAGIELYKEDNE